VPRVRRSRRGRNTPPPVAAILAMAVSVLVVARCATPHLPPSSPSSPPLTLPDRVSVRSAGDVVQVPLEDYVLGTILAEVSPSTEPTAVAARIFQVQAIVARSYARANLGRHRSQGFDFCDTTHCQIYDPARIRTSRLSDAARAAVQRTAGQILTYGRRPAEAVFHADCGGATAGADAVWGGRPVPYLITRQDDLEPAVHRHWRWTVTAAELRKALAGDTRTNVGERLMNLAVTARDESGRAHEVTIDGASQKVVRGEDLRTAVTRALGARTLQSTRFSVQRTGTSYVFEGTGFGHGVGLCQTGAAARARRGETVQAILSAYFADAVVTAVR
jgi:stage II sporulation protein D